MQKQAKILIVDDKEANRVVLTSHVIALGHSPILADNGRSALAQILTDWKREYNAVRPHSALGYRPPAPEAVVPLPLGRTA